MSSLTNIVEIENGVLILPFVNFPDYLVLKNVSRSFRNVCAKGFRYVLFYGIPVKLHPLDVFYHLFHQHYHLLEEQLIKNEDRTIIENVIPLNIIFEEDISAEERCTIHNRLWNGVSLLEIAYMNRDDRAVQLLTHHGRTIAHSIYSWESVCGINSLYLLKRYNEPALHTIIYQLIPPPYSM